MKPFFNYSRISSLFPVVILLLNFILRLTEIIARDISLDEPFSIYHAQFDPADIIGILKNYNNPPLFELLLHYWIKLFGIEPLAVRILPALFSIAASFSLYFLGKKHFSSLTGFIAAVLLSFSNLAQAYAHDCRVYSLFLLLSILSMDAFFTMMKKHSLKNMLLFILLSTLNIYAHYFAIILIAIQGLSIISFYRERLKHFLIGSAVIALLYIPHILVLLERFTHSARNGTWVKPPQGVESLYNMLWSFSNQPVTTVIASVFFLAAIPLIKSSSKEIKTVLLWFLIPVVGIFLLSFTIPMYLDRYLIFCAPAWYLLLAWIPEQISTNSKIKLSITLILSVSFILSFDPNDWTKRDVTKALSFVKQHKHDSTFLIVNPTEFIETFSYHYNREYFKTKRKGEEYKMLDSLMRSDRVYFANSPAEIPEKLENSDRIIYFDYSNGVETGSFMERFHETKLTTRDTVFENGFRVIVLETVSSP